MPEEISGTFDPEVDLNDDAVGTVEKNPNVTGQILVGFFFWGLAC